MASLAEQIFIECPPSDGIFRVSLHWQTTDYRALFGEFDGTLEVRPLDGHTVLSVEGCSPLNRPSGACWAT